MPPAATADHAELRSLIAALESSGLAERRPEARLLLEHSRAMLARRRAAPSAAKAARKLLALALLAGDVAGLGAVVFAVGWHRWLLLVSLAWLLFRIPAARMGLAELPRIAWYGLGWAYDWLAEAFGEAATLRLERRIAAWAMMREWRSHRRTQPGFEGLRGFGAQRGGWSSLDQAGPRLRALRWVALMRAFETLSQPPPPAFERHDPTLPDAVIITPEPPELIAHRASLRELIRRKRADITTAYAWKLKKPEEIAQREVHVSQLKAEVAALEAELAG